MVSVRIDVFRQLLETVNATCRTYASRIEKLLRLKFATPSIKQVFGPPAYGKTYGFNGQNLCFVSTGNFQVTAPLYDLYCILSVVQMLCGCRTIEQWKRPMIESLLKTFSVPLSQCIVRRGVLASIRAFDDRPPSDCISEFAGHTCWQVWLLDIHRSE